MSELRPKVMVLGAVVIGLLVLPLSGCKKGRPEAKSPTDKQNQQELEAGLQTEPARERKQAIDVELPAQSTKSRGDEIGLAEEVQAERLYQMALTESEIARKPFMSYKRMVDYCRQILQRFPNSRYAPKARELLRQMPERYRKQYSITEEETAL